VDNFNSTNKVSTKDQSMKNKNKFDSEFFLNCTSLIITVHRHPVDIVENVLLHCVKKRIHTYIKLVYRQFTHGLNIEDYPLCKDDNCSVEASSDQP